jgi:hypothetical protein
VIFVALFIVNLAIWIVVIVLIVAAGLLFLASLLGLVGGG